MKLDFVRKELRDYINSEIKPVYKTFDKAHSISHFNFVTKNCIDYGTELKNKGIDVNLEMAYVVGALHDIGISKGRETISHVLGAFSEDEKAEINIALDKANDMMKEYIVNTFDKFMNRFN